jgi:D-amino-acid dehydrogenase
VTDVIVIGGGISGSAVAYHLARDGVDTLAVARGRQGEATSAGAGILCPTVSSRSASDTWYEFAIDAVRYYPELVAALEATGVEETGYRQTGVLGVAVDEDERSAFDTSLQRARERAAEYPEKASTVREIPPTEAHEYCPVLADPQRAYYVEQGARVDGRTFADALLEAGRAHGLRSVEGTATDIRVENGRVAGVETEAAAYGADAVVVAGGVWSSELGENLGIDVPVQAHRGQIAHIEPTEHETTEWPVVNAFRGHYVVPWPDRVVAGATREPEAGRSPWLTVGGVKTVVDEALRVVPGLETARVTDFRVGLRPASADGLPILGRAPGTDGLYFATGHGATGLQLAPYSGKLVASAVTNGENEALAPYRIDRFE